MIRMCQPRTEHTLGNHAWGMQETLIELDELKGANEQIIGAESSMDLIIGTEEAPALSVVVLKFCYAKVWLHFVQNWTTNTPTVLLLFYYQNIVGKVTND